MDREGNEGLREYLGAIGAMKRKIKLSMGDPSGKPAEMNEGSGAEGSEAPITVYIGGKPVGRILDEDENELRRG